MELRNPQYLAPYGILFSNSDSSLLIKGANSPSSRKILKSKSIQLSNTSNSKKNSHHNEFTPIGVISSQLYTVSDLLKSTIVSARGYQPPIAVPEECKITTLIEHFFNSSSSHAVIKNQNGSLVGIVHLSNIVTLCCQNFLKWNTCYEFMYKCKEQFNTATAKDLLTNKEFSDSKLYNSISFLSPIIEVMKLFARDKVEDAVVLGDDMQESLAIINQIDLLNFLYHHSKDFELEDILKKKIMHFKINKSNFDPNINKIEFAIEAFDSLWLKQIKGNLISHGKSLIDKFLNIIVQIMSLEISSDISSNDNVVTVYEIDTIEKTIQLVGTRNIQRIFVCDSSSKVIGEITVNDLIGQFINSIFKRANAPPTSQRC